MKLRYDGVKRDVSPPAGSIVIVPAGTPSKWQWSGPRDTLTVYLEAERIERVAAEAFELDAARLTIPPLAGLDLPGLRAAMLAVDSEMTSGAAGSPLAAECLANILAVELIRQVTAPRATARRPDGPLPRRKLRAVVDYIHANLDANLTLEQIAAAAHLSAYHFARQFKAATGMPPYQYVIARRVERARQLLQHGGDESSLAEIALRAGFSDQSQFSNHFKRVAGVTPMQFRRSAGPQESPKSPQAAPRPELHCLSTLGPRCRTRSRALTHGRSVGRCCPCADRSRLTRCSTTEGKVHEDSSDKSRA
jgi:AraC family transcriptional regulator